MVKKRKKTVKSLKHIKKTSKKIALKKHPKKIVHLNLKKKVEKKELFIKTNVPGFNDLFEEAQGIPESAAVLVEGGPGSGKTIFCLSSMIHLCRQGKKGLYMSFEEPEEKLIEHMRNFNWEVDEFLKRGMIRVKRFDTIDVSRSIEALLSAAKKELLIEVDPVLFPSDYHPDFIVVDSLTSIASAFTGQDSRFRVYMEQLFRYLEKHKITSFLIREVSSPSHVGTVYKEQGEAVSFLSDGIIVIYNVIYDSGARGSAIEILKMRGTAFKKKIVEMQIINKKGVVINPDKILKKDDQVGFQLT